MQLLWHHVRAPWLTCRDFFPWIFQLLLSMLINARSLYNPPFPPPPPQKKTLALRQYTQYEGWSQAFGAWVHSHTPISPLSLSRVPRGLVPTLSQPPQVTRGLYMRTTPPHPWSYQTLVHDSSKTILCQKAHDVGPQNGWPNLHKTVGVLTQVREYVWNFHSISIQQVIYNVIL